jgi:GH15 family glucan-1,4-alpha-glucosidase
VHINETDSGITAFYHPDLDAVVQYKDDTFFLMGGATEFDGLYEFSVGIGENQDLGNIWDDAEDGELNNKLVSHGSIDSIISLRQKLGSKEEGLFYSWLAAGRSLDEVSKLNSLVKEKGMRRLIIETKNYSKTWVNKNEINFKDLSPKIVNLFKQSLLILRTQIDNRGGIIASSDSEILHYNDDTYNYVWPRDGAFTAMGLDFAGYFDVTRQFFDFCSKIVSKDGFLYQKYNSDGTWGSNWHPWSNDRHEAILPIQEDATALVLFSLWNHYLRSREIESIKPFYKPLVCATADFMVNYRAPESKLPLPSYDLWEEYRGVSTFTTSAVFGGLEAASNISRLFGDQSRVEAYSNAANEVKTAMINNLYDEKSGRFLKMLKCDGKGSFAKDLTIDSSVFGVFGFGVLPANDYRVENTMRAVESLLWVQTKVGGIARFENDIFHRVQGNKEVPGNPWIVCTLWLAQWYIANKNLPKGLELIEWVIERALESGILPEQINPYTNDPLSVSPLTWSHSTFITTVIKYLQTQAETRNQV